MGFGFGLGLSSKKKWSSQTDTTTNTTTTPTLPEWASGLTQSVGGRIASLLQLDPNGFGATANPLQQQAAANAAALGGGTNPATAPNATWLNPYLNADTPFASGGKAYNFVDRYLNPYLHDTVDSTAADLDANAGQVRAQQALDLAGSGAFGGSGAALTQSMTEGELARARASTLSGLRSHAYDTALSAAAGDAERATQARIANAQTALQDRAQKVDWRMGYDANQRANIASQAEIGGTLRDIDSSARNAPITSTQQIVAMLSGLPLSLFAGQTVSGSTSERSSGKSKDTPGALDAAKVALQVAAMGA